MTIAQRLYVWYCEYLSPRWMDNILHQDGSSAVETTYQFAQEFVHSQYLWLSHGGEVGQPNASCQLPLKTVLAITDCNMEALRIFQEHTSFLEFLLPIDSKGAIPRVKYFLKGQTDLRDSSTRLSVFFQTSRRLSNCQMSNRRL